MQMFPIDQEAPRPIFKLLSKQKKLTGLMILVFCSSCETHQDYGPFLKRLPWNLISRKKVHYLRKISFLFELCCTTAAFYIQLQQGDGGARAWLCGRIRRELLLQQNICRPDAFSSAQRGFTQNILERSAVSPQIWASSTDLFFLLRATNLTEWKCS